MPCPDCDKKISSPKFPAGRLNANLDLAELALIAALATDIEDYDKVNLEKLISIVQMMKHPHQITLDQQLRNIVSISRQTMPRIECRYCRMHFYWDVVASAQVAGLLSIGKYGAALKLMAEKELKKTWWLMLAVLYRKILPKF